MCCLSHCSPWPLTPGWPTPRWLIQSPRTKRPLATLRVTHEPEAGEREVVPGPPLRPKPRATKRLPRETKGVWQAPYLAR